MRPSDLPLFNQESSRPYQHQFERDELPVDGVVIQFRTLPNTPSFSDDLSQTEIIVLFYNRLTNLS